MIDVEARPHSATIFEHLKKRIPGGVNSPVRSTLGLIDVPMVAERGEKEWIIDADQYRYIDYCMSWGALIHGHAHPEIIQAAYDQMLKGTTYGITTEIELKLAEKILRLMPSMEKIRFVSSGTEATMSALRLARGYTGRVPIIKFAGHYHGHADFLLVKAGSGLFGLNGTSTSAGVSEDTVKQTIVLPFNDVDAFKKVMSEQLVAAVILEPIAGNMGLVKATEEFMTALREETEKQEALLIFDEVMTGFRVAKGGAQSLYGIDPDLTTLAKIMGGGFPAAAFGGKQPIMDRLAPLGPVYQAGTLSGNPVAMAAGLKALEILDRPGFYESLALKQRAFLDPIKEYIAKNNLNVVVQEALGMFCLYFGVKEVKNMSDAEKLDKALFKKFFRYMFDNGIYIPPSQYEAWFLSAAHTDQSLARTQSHIFAFFDSL
jgi:glutamate-1-semialdehyde 2,1-aminomutase